MLTQSYSILCKTTDNIYIYIYIAMDINVLPSASRGLLSAPETENGMGSSGGTKESD